MSTFTFRNGRDAGGSIRCNDESVQAWVPSVGSPEERMRWLCSPGRGKPARAPSSPQAEPWTSH